MEYGNLLEFVCFLRAEIKKRGWKIDGDVEVGSSRFFQNKSVFLRRCVTLVTAKILNRCWKARAYARICVRMYARDVRARSCSQWHQIYPSKMCPVQKQKESLLRNTRTKESKASRRNLFQPQEGTKYNTPTKHSINLKDNVALDG